MSIKRLALCAFAILLSASAPMRAAEIDDAMNKLAVEAAKAGNIIWYESSPDDQADKIVAAFQKRFPGLKLDHIRDTGGNTVGGRIVQESQGDTRTADVATTGAAISVPLQERKLIKEIDWNAYGLSKELAPTPYGVVTTSVVYVIVYNTALVKEADAPKTWDDLLNPRWDGKIGIWVRGEGQGSLAATWGAEKVFDYVRKMNALHPVLLPSTFPLAQQVAAGEILVGFGLNHTAQPPIRRGAPIKVVVGRPGAAQHALQLRAGEGEKPERRRAGRDLARDARRRQGLRGCDRPRQSIHPGHQDLHHAARAQDVAIPGRAGGDGGGDRGAHQQDDRKP